MYYILSGILPHKILCERFKSKYNLRFYIISYLQTKCSILFVWLIDIFDSPVDLLTYTNSITIHYTNWEGRCWKYTFCQWV